MTSGTIGSGGTYATVALWVASIPSTLSVDDIGSVIWTSSASELTITAEQVITGITVAGHKIILRPNTGAGIADNGSKLSNALRYNANNGACIRRTDSGTGAVLNLQNDSTEIRGMQLKKSADYGRVIRAANGNPGIVLDSLICQHSGGADNTFIVGSEAIVSNLLIITNGQSGFENTGGNNAITDVTAVCTGTPTLRTGIQRNYGTPVFKNCVSAGFATDYAGTASASSSNNATDQSSFGGTNFGGSGQVSLVATTEWQSVTSGSEDLRVKGTSVKLTGNGATTGPTADIVGSTRSAPYTIGAWQVAPAGDTLFAQSWM